MIQRVFSLLLLLSLQLFAYSYDQKIIDIEAKLFPKIAMLEHSLQQQDSKTLQLYIVCNSVDTEVAKEFKSTIEKFHTAPIGGKKVSVKIIDKTELHKAREGAIIVLYHTPHILKTIANWANYNHVVSFIYDPLQLDYGFLASIYIGKSTKPYLNKKTIEKYDFNFDTYLLGLSKFKE